MVYNGKSQSKMDDLGVPKYDMDMGFPTISDGAYMFLSLQGRNKSKKTNVKYVRRREGAHPRIFHRTPSWGLLSNIFQHSI